MSMQKYGERQYVMMKNVLREKLPFDHPREQFINDFLYFATFKKNRWQVQRKISGFRRSLY